MNFNTLIERFVTYQPKEKVFMRHSRLGQMAMVGLITEVFALRNTEVGLVGNIGLIGLLALTGITWYVGVEERQEVEYACKPSNPRREHEMQEMQAVVPTLLFGPATELTGEGLVIRD